MIHLSAWKLFQGWIFRLFFFFCYYKCHIHFGCTWTFLCACSWSQICCWALLPSYHEAPQKPTSAPILEYHPAPGFLCVTTLFSFFISAQYQLDFDTETLLRNYIIMQDLADIYLFLWCKFPNKFAINQITKKQLRHSEPGASGEHMCMDVFIHLYIGILTLNSLKGSFRWWRTSTYWRNPLYKLRIGWLSRCLAQRLADRQQRVTEVRHRMMQKSETNTEERQSETPAVPLFQKSSVSDSPKPHVHLPTPPAPCTLHWMNVAGLDCTSVSIKCKVMCIKSVHWQLFHTRQCICCYENCKWINDMKWCSLRQGKTDCNSV